MRIRRHVTPRYDARMLYAATPCYADAAALLPQELLRRYVTLPEDATHMGIEILPMFDSRCCRCRHALFHYAC